MQVTEFILWAEGNMKVSEQESIGAQERFLLSQVMEGGKLGLGDQSLDRTRERSWSAEKPVGPSHIVGIWVSVKSKGREKRELKGAEVKDSEGWELLVPKGGGALQAHDGSQLEPGKAGLGFLSQPSWRSVRAMRVKLPRGRRGRREEEAETPVQALEGEVKRELTRRAGWHLALSAFTFETRCHPYT